MPRKKKTHTTGWIYDVRATKTRTRIVGSDELKVHDFQYKISWCMMEPAKRGGFKIQTFEREVLHKGKKTTTSYYAPVKRDKKIMTTWVDKLPTGNLPSCFSLSMSSVIAHLTLFVSTEILRIVQENGGKATATSLSILKQKHRALMIPITIHPTTSTKASMKVNTTNTSVFSSFRKAPRTPSAVQWTLPREGSSEEEETPRIPVLIHLGRVMIQQWQHN
jgi:hypothetical protein